MTRESLLECWEATSAQSQTSDHQKIARQCGAVLADSMQNLSPKRLIAAYALIDLHRLRSGREALYNRAVHADAENYFLRGMVSLDMIDEERCDDILGSNKTGLVASVTSLVVPDQTYDLYRSASDACPLVTYSAAAVS